MDKRLILLVEDDHTGRMLWLYRLRKEGFLVQEARDGEEALRRFKPEHHGMVITDLGLPGRSGIEVIRLVKEIAPHVPVLAITAFGYQKIINAAAGAGVDEVLQKPFTCQQLISTVAQMMACHELDEVAGSSPKASMGC